VLVHHRPRTGHFPGPARQAGRGRADGPRPAVQRFVAVAAETAGAAGVD